MKYDTIIIGAGLSGLSAASLLAKGGLRVAVMEQASKPGGACGIFKRKDAVFDQGAAMLYGFGQRGFNAHRFLFNCLEESFQALRHELLYTVHYRDRTIRFPADVNAFIEELSAAFPRQKNNIRRFYKDMLRLYTHVIVQTPSYTTPDETNLKEAMKSVMKHPVSYMKFLYYLNISAGKLLRSYFTDPDILHFFDKLTSTYCYTTADETPAVLASVMFIDNHEGGSYYPAGSTLFLPGKLEKVIEENGGDMYYDTHVKELVFSAEKPCGVLTDAGDVFHADELIYSGTVWNLYDGIIPSLYLTQSQKNWASIQFPTYSSLVFYGLTDSSVIPPGTCPIEMLSSGEKETDESEVTVYIMSLDDHTLCPEDCHVIVAIGPSFRHWEGKTSGIYEMMKQEELDRFVKLLEKRFPGFEKGLLYAEMATPQTIERYTLKNHGAAAGPKQMLGQHMLMRQSIRTKWNSLFCCGESTTMGTGTPTVTTSGIAAANAILKKRGLKAFIWDPKRPEYVEILKPPVEHGWQYDYYPDDEADLMIMAGKCMYCLNPSCCSRHILDIPAIMRRITCGNFHGALKTLHRQEPGLMTQMQENADLSFLSGCEERCIRKTLYDDPVKLSQIIVSLFSWKTEDL